MERRLQLLCALSGPVFLVMFVVGLWFIAWDVVRYRPLLILTAFGYLLAGPAFVLIDLTAGMPWLSAAGNGGSCLLIGVLLLGLLWGERMAVKTARQVA